MRRFLRFGGQQAPLPVEYDTRYTRVLMVKATGWTLDYIDGLSQQDINDVLTIFNTMQYEAERAKS